MSQNTSKTKISAPIILTKNTTGKLTAKIVIKDDFVKKNGTSPIYLQIFLDGVRKRINIDLEVEASFFDKTKMRVRKGYPRAKDINLVIERTLSELNQIELFYRLANLPLTVDLIEKELKNPSSRLDFIKFMEEQLEEDSKVLNEATVRSIRNVINKIKEFQNPIYFMDLSVDVINDILLFMKNKKGNTQNTLFNVTKIIRKYLRRAEKLKINVPITYIDVPHKKVRSEIEHLEPYELKTLMNYYETNLPHMYKSVLAKFLFSSMTGLRISDILALNSDSFLEGFLLKFTSIKSKKIQRIKLNSTAKKILEDGFLLMEPHKEPTINRKLKEIATLCTINKRIHFHMARHSFATNFLKQGGRIEVLQRLLAHSSIRDTMNYVHVVEDDINKEVFLLDNIFEDEFDDDAEFLVS